MPATTGTVIEVSAARAVVMCAAAAGCARCAAGNGCGNGLMERLLGHRLRTVEVQVPASIPVEAGDVVTLTIRNDTLVRGAAVVYLLPLLGLVLGCVAGSVALPATGDAGVLAGGALGLFAALAVPRWLPAQSRRGQCAMVLSRGAGQPS